MLIKEKRCSYFVWSIWVWSRVKQGNNTNKLNKSKIRWNREQINLKQVFLCPGTEITYPWLCYKLKIFQVNNNCATGSTALFMAKQLVEGGKSFDSIIHSATYDWVYNLITFWYKKTKLNEFLIFLEKYDRDRLRIHTSYILYFIYKYCLLVHLDVNNATMKTLT